MAGKTLKNIVLLGLVAGGMLASGFNANAEEKERKSGLWKTLLIQNILLKIWVMV